MLLFLGLALVVGFVHYQHSFFLESSDHVEAGSFADDEIVAAIVHGETFVDEHVPVTVVVTSDLQSAGDAVTVDGAVVELVLFDHIFLVKREVSVGQQVPAKVVGTLEASNPAAGAWGGSLVMALARRFRRLRWRCGHG